ncbi:MAG: NAD(P)-dependent oxidoreductase [Pseudomonadota bacterium]
MRYLPVFIDLQDRLVSIIAGACDKSDMVLAKIRMLAKTKAQITLLCHSPSQDLIEYIKAHNNQAKTEHKPKIIIKNHLCDFNTLKDEPLGDMVYIAIGDEKLEKRLAEMLKKRNKWVNIVDQADNSDFITPAIIDRAPIVVAIGSEGSAPALVRMIKQKFEFMLPEQIGKLAVIAQKMRPHIKPLFTSFQYQKRFWYHFFDVALSNKTLVHDHEKAIKNKISNYCSHLVRQFLQQHQIKPAVVEQPQSVSQKPINYNLSAHLVINDTAEQSLKSTKNKHVREALQKPYMYLIEDTKNHIGELTSNQQKIIQASDCVIYDHHIKSAILELAPREAKFIKNNDLTKSYNEFMRYYIQFNQTLKQSSKSMPNHAALDHRMVQYYVWLFAPLNQPSINARVKASSMQQKAHLLKKLALDFQIVILANDPPNQTLGKNPMTQFFENSNSISSMHQHIA